MGDFSYLSDTDDSAVDELVAQTKDLCVLEQVSAINCAGLTDDSLLPTDLESRFRKLKSFPLTKPAAAYAAAGRRSSGKPGTEPGPEEAIERFSRSIPRGDAKSGSSSLSPSEEGGIAENGHGSRAKSGRDSPNSDTLSDSSAEEAIFAPAKLKSNEKRRGRSKLRDGSFSPSPSPSPSPPRKAGCFWCSPKKSPSRRKRDDARVKKGLGLDWVEEDEFLSDLGVFSAKEQRKMLKTAMKEEAKMNREAEKIVKMVKQVSEKMMKVSASSRPGEGHSSDD